MGADSCPHDDELVAVNLVQKLIDILTQLIPFIGYPRTLNGFRMVDEVAPA
jgi:hypothetical protein